MTSLPAWLQGLPDPERMRATDRWAIEEQGIPGLELMERAGQGLADLVASVAPDGPIAIACGKGNNGGDGYVAARLLREAGRAVRVLAVAPVSELSGDARANAERVDGIEPFAAARLADCSVAVDALLGTGFSGTPHGAVADAIDALNDARPAYRRRRRAQRRRRCQRRGGGHGDPGPRDGDLRRGQARAVDQPGQVARRHGARDRHRHPAGRPGRRARRRPHRGCATARAAAVARGRVDEVHERARARRGRRARAHGCAVAGRRGRPARGAGYVTACVPASAQPIVAQRLLEAMTRALPEDDGAHTAAGVEEVLELAQRGGALVVGPGLGRSDGAFAFARDLVARAEVAVVLDADGLNAHAGDLGALAGRKAPTILTPHEGELGRLLEVESSAVAARRLEHARAAAAQAQAIVVLKGDDTLVADPGGLVAVSPGATGALATAGTGDVLSGVLAAVLSRDVEPFTAACAGVRLHARAGIHAAHVKGVDGVIARDVIEALPFAR